MDPLPLQGVAFVLALFALIALMPSFEEWES
jgi:hypothetical protein